MNGFNQSYVYRSTKTERKGRRIKHHRDESCECVPHFMKFHFHDCPEVVKPCPIHGNRFHCSEKVEKAERGQNVIISFHPSKKTERLLQPIKTFLSHCNSETKINFQYYSPENSISKDSLKSENCRSKYDNLKRTLNNNIFIETTKSFVANNMKTNKVKKLKQCFHSPCNSIAQKTRSQTSVKEEINQILREEAKQARNMFYNMVPEIPLGETKYDPTTKWFSSVKGDFKNRDVLSDDKLDSDFITVTQQDRNNSIHHKIFEIKHRKGVNDIPFVGFPCKQPTSFVYSAVNVPGTTAGHTGEQPDEKQSEDAKEERHIDVGTSEKGSITSSSSSSSSVYVSPFIILPKGLGDTQMLAERSDQGIQVEGPATPRSQKETQTTAVSNDQIHEIVDLKKPSENSVIEKVKTEAVIKSNSVPYEEQKSHSSRQTNDMDLDTVEGAVMRNYEAGSLRRNLSSYTTANSRILNEQNNNTNDYQTKNLSDMSSGLRNKISQTDDQIRQNSQPESNQSQVSDMQKSPSIISQKQVATTALEQPNSENVASAVKPLGDQTSDQMVDRLPKIWYGKSHSESDLYDRIKRKEEISIPFLQFRKPSDFNNNTQKRPTDSGKENNPKGGTFTLRTKEIVERHSETKQTSTRVEEISAAVSDLTELKIIIQDFFEKRNPSSNVSGEIANDNNNPVLDLEPEKQPVESAIQTDNSFSKQMAKRWLHKKKPIPLEPQKHFVESEIQTSLELLPKAPVRNYSIGIQTMSAGGIPPLEPEKHLVESEIQTSLELLPKAPVRNYSIGIQTMSAGGIPPLEPEKHLVESEIQTSIELLPKAPVRNYSIGIQTISASGIPPLEPEKHLVESEIQTSIEFLPKAPVRNYSIGIQTMSADGITPLEPEKHLVESEIQTSIEFLPKAPVRNYSIGIQTMSADGITPLEPEKHFVESEIQTSLELLPKAAVRTYSIGIQTDSTGRISPLEQEKHFVEKRVFLFPNPETETAGENQTFTETLDVPTSSLEVDIEEKDTEMQTSVFVLPTPEARRLTSGENQTFAEKAKAVARTLDEEEDEKGNVEKETCVFVLPTPEARRLTSGENQTFAEKAKALARTLEEEKDKRDAEVQTSDQKLLDEAERIDPSKPKAPQSVSADNETASKSFFICSLCARELKETTNTGMNTDPCKTERKERVVAVGREYSELLEFQRNIKTENPNYCNLIASQHVRRSDKCTEKTLKYCESPATICSQRSRIPIRYQNLSESRKLAKCPSPDYLYRKPDSCRTLRSDNECEIILGACENRVRKPSSTQNAIKGPRVQPTPNPSAQRKECQERHNNNASGSQSNPNKKPSTNSYYPALFTLAWPKEFMTTWKSMENVMNDTPSSDDCKSQTAKQKSSYEKDLQTIVTGKKIKVNAEQHKKQCTFGMTGIRKRQYGDYEIWPGDLTAYQTTTPEDERSSTEADEVPEKLSLSPSENYLENPEDLPDSERFSEINNTPENSSLEYEEREEEEVAVEEIGEQDFKSFSVMPAKIKANSRSKVTLSRSFFSDTLAASKSLNAFLLLIDRKKKKRRYHRKS